MKRNNTLKCKIPFNHQSTCTESSTMTRVNTVTQISTMDAKNDNFPGRSNFVPSEKQDETDSPLLIVIVVICAIILVLIVFFIVHHVKLKPPTKLSPSFVDLQMTQLEVGQPPASIETTDCDRNQSPPPRYESVYDIFKATGDSSPS